MTRALLAGLWLCVTLFSNGAGAADAYYPGTPRWEYNHKHQQRWREATDNAASYEAMVSLPESIKGALCGPSSLFTLLPREQANNFHKFVNYLLVERKFGPDGMDDSDILDVLQVMGYPSEFMAANFDADQFLARMADYLDEGRVVFLKVDGVEMLKTEKRRGEQRDDVDKFIASNSLKGVQHIVRLTAIERDDAGTATKFGLWDVLDQVSNPSRGTILDKPGLVKALNSTRLKTVLRLGGFVSKKPANSALVFPGR